MPTPSPRAKNAKSKATAKKQAMLVTTNGQDGVDKKSAKRKTT